MEPLVGGSLLSSVSQVRSPTNATSAMPASPRAGAWKCTSCRSTARMSPSTSAPTAPPSSPGRATCVSVWRQERPLLFFFSLVCSRFGPFTSSLVPQTVKNLPAVQEPWVQSRHQEEPLEQEMETHATICVWRTPWTGAWQPTVHGVARLEYDRATKTFTFHSCFTVQRESATCIAISPPCWASLPPHPTPLGHPRALSWAPYAVQRLPASCVLHMMHVYVSVPLTFVCTVCSSGKPEEP